MKKKICPPKALVHPKKVRKKDIFIFILGKNIYKKISILFDWEQPSALIINFYFGCHWNPCLKKNYLADEDAKNIGLSINEEENWGKKWCHNLISNMV